MVMKTGDRIKMLREKLDISQSELAELCGWGNTNSSASRISNYENNIRNPKREDIIKIAKAFTNKFVHVIDPAWLQFGSGDIPPVIIFNNVAIPKGYIPILSPAEIKPDLDWRIINNSEWKSIPMFGNQNEKCYALRVKGDAMISSIPGKRSFLEDNIIIIDPEKSAKDGDFVIAIKGEEKEPIFSQFIDYAGKAYLKPLNPQYPTIAIDETITVIGVVTAHIDVLS